MRLAEIGIDKLREHVDVLVVIPNEMAFKFVPPQRLYIKLFK